MAVRSQKTRGKQALSEGNTAISEDDGTFAPRINDLKACKSKSAVRECEHTAAD